jgi:hypothetical protein
VEAVAFASAEDNAFGAINWLGPRISAVGFDTTQISSRLACHTTSSKRTRMMRDDELASVDFLAKHSFRSSTGTTAMNRYPTSYTLASDGVAIVRRLLFAGGVSS